MRKIDSKYLYEDFIESYDNEVEDNSVDDIAKNVTRRKILKDLLDATNKANKYIEDEMLRLQSMKRSESPFHEYNFFLGFSCKYGSIENFQEDMLSRISAFTVSQLFYAVVKHLCDGNALILTSIDSINTLEFIDAITHKRIARRYCNIEMTPIKVNLPDSAVDLINKYLHLPKLSTLQSLIALNYTLIMHSEDLKYMCKQGIVFDICSHITNISKFSEEWDKLKYELTKYFINIIDKTIVILLEATSDAIKKLKKYNISESFINEDFISSYDNEDEDDDFNNIIKSSSIKGYCKKILNFIDCGDIKQLFNNRYVTFDEWLEKNNLTNNVNENTIICFFEESIDFHFLYELVDSCCWYKIFAKLFDHVLKNPDDKIAYSGEYGFYNYTLACEWGSKRNYDPSAYAYQASITSNCESLPDSIISNLTFDKPLSFKELCEYCQIINNFKRGYGFEKYSHIVYHLCLEEVLGICNGYGFKLSEEGQHKILNCAERTKYKYKMKMKALDKLLNEIIKAL